MRIDNSQDVLKFTMADVSLFSQMNTRYMFSEMEKHCSIIGTKLDHLRNPRVETADAKARPSGNRGDSDLAL